MTAATGDPSAPLDPAVVRAWVEASCAAQGVPVKVTDLAVVRTVEALLSGPQRGVSRAAACAPPLVARSDEPERRDPAGVERRRLG